MSQYHSCTFHIKFSLQHVSVQCFRSRHARRSYLRQGLYNLEGSWQWWWFLNSESLRKRWSVKFWISQLTAFPNHNVTELQIVATWQIRADPLPVFLPKGQIFLIPVKSCPIELKLWSWWVKLVRSSWHRRQLVLSEKMLLSAEEWRWAKEGTFGNLPETIFGLLRNAK